MKNRRWSVKRKLAFILSCVLLLSMPLNVWGSSLNEAQQNAQETQSQIDDANSNISNLEQQKSQAESSIAELDTKLDKLMADMETLSDEMEDKEIEIQQTKEELAEAKRTEEKQYEDMKKRIQYMYENGNTTFLELLFTAENITDLLNKAEYVTSLSQYDREMLDNYAKIVELVEEKEEQLEKEYKEMEEMETELKSQRSETETLIDQKAVEVNAYIEQIGAESSRAAQLKSDLAAQQQQIDNMVQQQKADEEARRQAAADAEQKNKTGGGSANSKTTDNSSSKGSGNNSGGNTGGGSTGGGSNNGGSTGGGNTGGGSNNGGNTGGGNTGGGTSSGFTHPCPGRTIVSDEYGYRTDPVTGQYRIHNGIDLAAPANTPIYAAKDGTVTAAGFNASMGNYINISHGNGMTTVYMHCNFLSVSSGQKVSRGQQIGGVGTTGSSTGNHLHFEVRINGVAYNPRNYYSGW